MNLPNLVDAASQALLDANMMLVTAESCTGGLVTKLITDRAGSSAVFERGFVTYTNESKTDLLNVSRETFREHGAVSAECARQMATGALHNSKGHIAISITGIAGPGGGTDAKPVGLVYIGVASQDHSAAFECHFNGSRDDIRTQTAARAFQIILEKIT